MDTEAKIQHFHFLNATLRKLHSLADPWISQEQNKDLDPLPRSSTHAKWLPDALGLQGPHVQPRPSSSVFSSSLLSTLYPHQPPPCSSHQSLPSLQPLNLQLLLPGKPWPRSSQGWLSLVIQTFRSSVISPKDLSGYPCQIAPSIPSPPPCSLSSQHICCHHAAQCACVSPGSWLLYCHN